MNSPPDHAASTRVAFPHSEIPGSQVGCTSPRLIAAAHVLRRLSAPEHPPHTLQSLTTEFGDSAARRLEASVTFSGFVLAAPKGGLRS